MNFFATKIMKGKGLLYLNIHTTYICASSMTIRHHLTQGSGAGIAMNLFGFRNPKKYFKIVQNSVKPLYIIGKIFFCTIADSGIEEKYILLPSALLLCGRST